MSIKIYYFSGTGNSLAIARELKILLQDKTEIIHLSSTQENPKVQIQSEVLGFIFPVYFLDIPKVVENFLSMLEFKVNPYIFAVATCNGVPGHSLFTLDKLLNTMKQSLSSGFVMDMPGNAEVTPLEIESERLKNSKEKISLIADTINNKKIIKLEGSNSLKTHVMSSIIGGIGRNAISPKKFFYTEKCIGCGICKKVCAMKNIEIVNSKPNWNNNCASCLACFHWCPQKAIRMKNHLGKRRRYHHPDINIGDIVLKNKL